MAQNDGHCLTLAGGWRTRQGVKPGTRISFEQFIKDLHRPVQAVSRATGRAIGATALRIRIARAFDKAERCSVAGKKGRGQAVRQGWRGGAFRGGAGQPPRPRTMPRLWPSGTRLAKEDGALRSSGTLTDARKTGDPETAYEKDVRPCRGYTPRSGRPISSGAWGKEWRVDFRLCVSRLPANYVKISRREVPETGPGAQTGPGGPAPEMPTRKIRRFIQRTLTKGEQ
jgi:hypothetical protein